MSYEIIDNESDFILTEDESDKIIGNLKDEFIMESIFEQIENPLNNAFGNVDYLNIFDTRYSYLSTIYKDSTNFISKLNEVKFNIYCSIFRKIVEKYDLSYSNIDFDIIECAKVLYNFFILDYKDNITDFILNRILKEKKSIAKSLQGPEFSKSLGVNALKKVLKNKDDALIISNIFHVMSSIITEEMDNLEIIKTICEEDLIESTNYSIYQIFLEDFSMSPSKDFNKLFFDILLNKKDGYSTIVNNIKMELLNLAPKKS